MPVAVLCAMLSFSGQGVESLFLLPFMPLHRPMSVFRVCDAWSDACSAPPLPLPPQPPRHATHEGCAWGAIVGVLDLVFRATCNIVSCRHFHRYISTWYIYRTRTLYMSYT